MNKSLLTLLVIGTLVAVPGALAVGGAVGGLMSAQADAEAHYGVDYSGAVATAGDLKDKAKGQVDATLGMAADAAGQAQADAAANQESAMKTSVQAKTSILDDISANLKAFGSWAGSLFVKPEVDTPTASANAAHVAKDVQTHIQPGYVGADGIAHGDLTQSIGSGAGVQYNLPPPPTPKVNFLTSIKASFESWLHFG